MPAPRTGGLYKTGYRQFWAAFVEAVPSRAFRDGTGTFQIESLPNPEVTFRRMVSHVTFRATLGLMHVSIG
jgi:hypothetical protein